MELSFYNSFNDKYSNKTIDVKDLIEDIRTGRWKNEIERYRNCTDKEEKKKLKLFLPAVTVSGTFKSRYDDMLIKYSKLVVVDLDYIDKSDLVSLRERLIFDNSVVCYFESPSGGMKIFYMVDSNEKMHRNIAFHQISKYFKKTYGNSYEPDAKNKNLSRLCFVSYDPLAYFNPSPQMFHIDEKDDETEKFKEMRARYDNLETSTDMDYIFKVCDKMTRKSKAGEYRKGNRNHFIFVLACNLNRAGIYQDFAVRLIFNRYNSLDFKEVEMTVKSAYRNNRLDFGINPIKQINKPKPFNFGNNGK